MNRTLQKLNLLGVIALTVLCVFQWRENRRLNLNGAQLEKTRTEQSAKLAEREQAVKNTTADLESFRTQLTGAVTARSEADQKVAAAEIQVQQLTADKKVLQGSVANWAAAVSARDERIKKANFELQKLGEARNQAVVKYNDLAAKYNGVVKDLNAERAKAAPAAPAK